MSEPQPLTRPDVPKPPKYYTEPDFIDVRGLPTAYRRKGKGEPVLYFHGAGLSRMWIPFYEKLSEKVDLIVPEHPGFGETPLPDWLHDFTDMVIHYREFLDALGLDKVHVAGLSLGSWTAAEFAAFYPDRLKSLTLIAPIGLRVPDQPDYPDLFELGPAQLGGFLFNDMECAKDFAPAPTLDELIHGYGEGAALATLAWNPRYDLRLERRLTFVDCPTQVLRAENDRLVPDSIAVKYSEILPNCQSQIIAGSGHAHPSGHAIPYERPQETADAIADFVSSAA